MKKFKFKLQSVLEMREREFEDRQLELAKVQQKLVEQTQVLENLYANKKNLTHQLEEQLQSGVKIDFFVIKTYKDYIQELANQISYQHKVIIEIEQEVEEKRVALTEAMQAKKVLEKLKETHYNKFLKEFEEYEARELDEIALNTYRLKN